MLTPNSKLKYRYELKNQIGHGGFGVVWKAWDWLSRETVAIKGTFVKDKKYRKAFENEARMLYMLEHPALPKVFDIFSEGEGLFLVMKFIEGKNLDVLFEERIMRNEGPFLTAQVLQWADQILDVLEYLHMQKSPIVHRDIKPSNLILHGSDKIFLVDFGLAKGSPEGMTVAASVAGSTEMFAPLEQRMKSGTTPQADLFSLGATMYYLLTNEAPPDTMLERYPAWYRGENEPLQPASIYNQEIPLAVAEVIMHAMALMCKDRIATATEMRQSLLRASPSLWLTDTSSHHKGKTLPAQEGDIAFDYESVFTPETGKLSRPVEDKVQVQAQNELSLKNKDLGNSAEIFEQIEPVAALTTIDDLQIRDTDLDNQRNNKDSGENDVKTQQDYSDAPRSAVKQDVLSDKLKSTKTVEDASFWAPFFSLIGGGIVGWFSGRSLIEVLLGVMGITFYSFFSVASGITGAVLGAFIGLVFSLAFEYFSYTFIGGILGWFIGHYIAGRAGAFIGMSILCSIAFVIRWYVDRRSPDDILNLKS